MRTHTILGGDGTSLHVQETGRADGPAVLFIHGFSQCSRTWRHQMASELGAQFRLAAMDLRGHGQSDAPDDGYGDSRLWAEDVHAVIQALDLVRPVLVGWSYGGFVICDYLRYYGDHDISGVHFVGAATSISQETAPDVLGSGFLSLLPGFFSTDVEQSIRTLRQFLAISTHKTVSHDELYLALGYNACTAPAVRQALLSRTLDNDDVLAQLNVPALISQGEKDLIVNPSVAQRIASLVPNATLSTYAGAGHAIFVDEPERFNDELAGFVGSAAKSVMSGTRATV